MNQPLSPVQARVLPEHDDETACAIALDNFTATMRARLDQARAQSRTGWHRPNEVPLDQLGALLVKAVLDGDLVSIGGYAMMLHARAPGIGGTDVRTAFIAAAYEWAQQAFEATAVRDTLATENARHVYVVTAGSARRQSR